MAIDQDLRNAATAALMDRFNQVFLRHDPTALRGMIAEDCVIEKISPAPVSISKKPLRWVTAQ
jgi:hypothetical protein